jgi:hypothetical protein
MNVLSKIISIFAPKAKPGDFIWHKTGGPIFSVKLEDGSRYSGGQLWRKRGADGRWMYNESPLSAEEWDARQW